MISDTSILPFCFLVVLPPPCSTLFPYTTLFRSVSAPMEWFQAAQPSQSLSGHGPLHRMKAACGGRSTQTLDRKSTRLNSSHLGISYAVFCLKKKKTTRRRHHARPANNSMGSPDV